MKELLQDFQTLNNDFLVFEDANWSAKKFEIV